MKNILLICGSGASSGFMAAAIRKAAKKKRGEQVTVKAASESQIDERINEIDYLLIGPHLAYMLDDLKQKVADKNVLVSIIPQATYGTLNGEKALDLILTMEG